MTIIELKLLKDQAEELNGEAGQRSQDIILAALIKAKATEEAGKAISGSLDSVSGSLDRVSRVMKGIR